MGKRSPDAQKISKALLGLYESLIESANWQDSLQALGELLGGIGGHALVWDAGTARPVFGLIGGPFDPADATRYESYYHSLDPHHAASMRLPVGSIYDSAEHIDDAFVRRSEFYNDFLIPAGSRYILGQRLHEWENVFSSVAFQRPERMGPFEPSDHKLFEVVAPHLRTALRLQHVLHQKSAALAVAATTIDRLSLPIIVSDSRACCRLANASAEAILAAGDGLSARNKLLFAVDGRAHRELLSLIRATCGIAGPAGRMELPGALSVPRRSGLPPYAVIAVPTGTSQSGEPMCLMVIIDPVGSGVGVRMVLRRLFNLTVAECALVEGLADGLRLQEIADRRQVKLTTVRSQLASVFAKTGSVRQSDVVRLAERLAPFGGAKATK